MLSYTELAALDRDLRDTKVLSVYIPAPRRDPGARHARRIELDRALSDLRSATASAPRTDRASLERAVDALRRELAAYPDGLPATAYSAFVAEDGVRHASAMPPETPWLVAWEEGIRVAPYIRALEQLRPVVVAVVDSRRARVFRYREASLEKLETLRAHVHIEAPSHMGAGPRTGFKSNTRGRTGADAAQRELEAGTARMISEVAERLRALAGASAWIVCGGTPERARAVMEALPERLVGRAMVAPGLSVRSTMAEIAEHAAHGATTLRRARDLAAIEELLDRAARNGRGATSVNSTLHALADGSVQELFLTPGFLARHPRECETAARAALEQHSAIEVVSGEAAERLDAAAEGVGALLRFVARPVGAGSLGS